MLLCQIYRSTKKSETYLYTRFEDKLEKVPDDLMKSFGRAEVAMTLRLTKKRTLARADAAKVIQEIEEKGFYLQLPPVSFVQMPGQEQLDEQMAEIDALNEKIPRGG